MGSFMFLIQYLKKIHNDTLLEHMNSNMARTEKAITQVEEKLDKLNSRINNIENMKGKMAETNKKLQNCDECVDRSLQLSRANVRVLGLSEKAEQPTLIQFLEKWLPSVLNIDFSTNDIYIQRAYQITSKKPGSNNAFRTVLIKFSSGKARDSVFRAAQAKKELMFDGKIFLIFPDLSPITQEKRKSLLDIKDFAELEIKANLLYLAKLRVEFQD
uniref:L1 transposable element RRM domain-containing protein n=1 Tax=Latimeria chalumnae TaxID=7897 RepID=H3ARM3_LATCH